MRRTVPMLMWALLALGCEPDARNDANLFLERIGRIDLDDPIDQRRQRVESLASLPLSAEQVTRARDACVSAHRAVLEAEDAHARANAVIEPAQRANVKLSGDRARQVSTDIRRADAAIARSRRLFSRCHRLTRDLELRYRSRRSRAAAP